MVTAALCRTEANISDAVETAKFTASMARGVDEIKMIVENFKALVVDYAYLDESNDYFTQDDGDTYRFTYEQIEFLAAGYDSADDSNYVALLVKINIALVANGQDLLTDLDKLNLRQAGSDLRKAETNIALSHFAKIGNLRPAEGGGFTTQIAFGQSKKSLLSQDESDKISTWFYDQAYRYIFPWLRDPDSSIVGDSLSGDGAVSSERSPDSFTHPDISISAVPDRERFKRNPRGGYD